MSPLCQPELEKLSGQPFCYLQEAFGRLSEVSWSSGALLSLKPKIKSQEKAGQLYPPEPMCSERTSEAHTGQLLVHSPASVIPCMVKGMEIVAIIQSWFF